MGSAKAGEVWLTTNSNLNTSVPGTYGYLTFLHEIGHALGLDHPHEGVVASSSIDALPFSVMSYRDYVGDTNDIWDSGLFPTTPMLNDIAVIQHLYGANTATRSGDTTYSWTVGKQIYETIWDGGGNDAIDWSNQSSAATINLNAGQWSYIGPTRWDGHVYTQQNLAIAYNVVIEDAIGGTGADIIIGNSAPNTLSGNAGNDRLEGRGGNDRFDWEASGRAGADTFLGGLGNDEYVISGNDQIMEGDGEGTDTIWATANFSIGAIPNVEKLFLFGPEPASATGNSIGNEILGNDENNALDGRAGADTLMGGLGRDTLTGANGNDKLVGQGGSDVLRGGAGNDRLTGGGGSDRFDFSVALNAASNVDKIADFNVPSDVMRLDNDIFTAFATANVTLTANAFYAKAGNTTAHDDTVRIIYNPTTGTLYYDADGIGNVAPKPFAILTNEAAIAAADFVIVA